MTHSELAKSDPLNPRELTGYLFVLTLIALAFAIGWMLVRMFEPHGDWHSLAIVSDLTNDPPTPYSLQASDGTSVHLWLVNNQGQWRAYDGFTPTRSTKCLYAWQPVTSRFEDPCSGAKFELDGKHLDGIYDYAYLLSSDLIQYQVQLRGKELWVNLLSFP